MLSHLERCGLLVVVIGRGVPIFFRVSILFSYLLAQLPRTRGWICQFPFRVRVLSPEIAGGFLLNGNRFWCLLPLPLPPPSRPSRDLDSWLSVGLCEWDGTKDSFFLHTFLNWPLGINHQSKSKTWLYDTQRPVRTGKGRSELHRKASGWEDFNTLDAGNPSQIGYVIELTAREAFSLSLSRDLTPMRLRVWAYGGWCRRVVLLSLELSLSLKLYNYIHNKIMRDGSSALIRIQDGCKLRLKKVNDTLSETALPISSLVRSVTLFPVTRNSLPSGGCVWTMSAAVWPPLPEDRLCEEEANSLVSLKQIQRVFFFALLSIRALPTREKIERAFRLPN